MLAIADALSPEALAQLARTHEVLRDARAAMLELKPLERVPTDQSAKSRKSEADPGKESPKPPSEAQVASKAKQLLSESGGIDRLTRLSMHFQLAAAEDHRECAFWPDSWKGPSLLGSDDHRYPDLDWRRVGGTLELHCLAGEAGKLSRLVPVLVRLCFRDLRPS